MHLCSKCTIAKPFLKVISLSSLFEHPQYSDEPVVLKDEQYPKVPVDDPYHRQALLWYNRSLSNLRIQIEQGTVGASVALVSCILYICIELLQDNVTEALALFQRGLDLLSGNNLKLLEPSISPFFYNLNAIGRIVGYLKPATVFVLQTTFPNTFTSLEEAENAIYALSEYCMAPDRASARLQQIESIDEELMTVLMHEQRIIQAKLDCWYRNFQDLNITLDSDISREDKFQVSRLCQAWAALSLSVKTCTTVSEMAYDSCMHLFEEILYYGRYGIEATRYADGKQPPFLLETSVGLPMFMVATQCRDYCMRHEALDLLRQAPKVQGLIKSVPYAILAAKMIELEEEGLELSYGADGKEPGMFIPMHRRVRDIAVTSTRDANGRRTYTLRYIRRVPDEHGVLLRIEETVPI